MIINAGRENITRIEQGKPHHDPHGHLKKVIREIFYTQKKRTCKYNWI